ncbi:MAG: thioredoxin family protein [Helicobacteraceae bacterium]|jgi:thiol-disulfide isomerase/thioredoxin|nr:thioredoxin family protein [Helicobacteraceae bacterium]
MTKFFRPFKDNIRSLLPIILLVTTVLSANTMYTLAGVKKVYPVVEVSGINLSKTHKKLLYAQLKTVTDELAINTSGYDQRSLALIVNEMYVGKTVVIKVRLLIGEEVRRLDSDTKTFALTYDDTAHFILSKDDDVEENLEDTLDTLLAKFSEQYIEENKAFTKVVIDETDFAKAMGYETNYEAAVKKAKKSGKNIMLVLVSNYCPWCRKFEERVLLKKEVNAMIQQNYIPLIINKEKEPFPKKFDKGFTPIIHFIDYKTLQSYASVVGYNSKDEFLYLLDKHR